MNRLALVFATPVLMLALVAVWLGSPPDALPARHAPADCRRVEVRGEQGPLTGIEDLALLADGRLLLSARDRRKAGLGGLYTLHPAQLDHSGPADALRLPGTRDVTDPQGIALDRTGERLAFVERPAGGEAAVAWGVLAGGAFRRDGELRGPDWCRANDLAFDGADLYVSIDRGACGIGLADLWPGNPTGRVARIATGSGFAEHLPARFAFANGLAVRGGELLVAETRAARIAAVPSGREMRLPGGPDNLGLSPDGKLIVALHPNLLRLALWMGSLARHASSRIALVDPAGGETEILFDDAEGTLFSGATSAVMLGGRLVAGSAFDHGLLVCGGKA